MSVKAPELVCQQVVELVNEYLGHRLSAEDRRAFDEHLETCPPCTTYLEQMKTVVDLAGSLGEGAAPAEVEPQLLDLFRRWHDKSAD